MPGLYLHIPFCRQACHYCDFHFSTSQKMLSPLLRAMEAELQERRAELGAEAVFETVYFGGGTPSLLTIPQISALLETIRSNYRIAPDAELTLEANPDDLSEKYLAELHALGINRLSIGIQSFRDEDLQLMNRAHSAIEARDCVTRAQAAGFGNLSIDLIYGIPGLGQADWEENLRRAFSLNVQHISAYCLTVEPRTALAHFVHAGKVKPVNDEDAAAQFRRLAQRMREEGFVHYEISNFGRPGFFSRHNTSYWKGTPYIGVGPSAHSYDGMKRRWNVANNAQYAAALKNKEIYWEEETLNVQQRYNEYVMISLRTLQGSDVELIRAQFGENFAAHFLKEAETWIAAGRLVREENIFRLDEEGQLLADRIASDLFF